MPLSRPMGSIGSERSAREPSQEFDRFNEDGNQIPEAAGLRLTYLISIGFVDKPCEEPACLWGKNGGRVSVVTALRTPDLEKAFTSDLVA
jgi:hypothetical protein